MSQTPLEIAAMGGEEATQLQPLGSTEGLIQATTAPGAGIGEDSQKAEVVLNHTTLLNDHPLHVYGSNDWPLLKAMEVCGFLGIGHVATATSKLRSDEKFAHQRAGQPTRMEPKS